MPDSSETLEESIVNKFIGRLEESEDISEGISDAITGLSEQEDFGGRDRIAGLVLEEVGDDEN